MAMLTIMSTKKAESSVMTEAATTVEGGGLLPALPSVADLVNTFAWLLKLKFYPRHGQVLGLLSFI